MNKIKHWSIALGSTAIVALALATSAFAAPSSYFDFTSTFTEDTGIACGSGPGSFDVINSETRHRYGPSFSDVNGNFVMDILDVDTVGAFSNSVTGASIRYKARGIQHDSLAIPGDFNSTFTSVTTGALAIIAPGAGVVWQDTGRVVDSFEPNGNESLTWSGQQDDLVYGFLGQTDVADKLCAALGA